MFPDDLVLVSETGCDRPRLGIVVMARVPDKTLVNFGKTIFTDNDCGAVEAIEAAIAKAEGRTGHAWDQMRKAGDAAREVLRRIDGQEEPR